MVAVFFGVLLVLIAFALLPTAPLISLLIVIGVATVYVPWVGYVAAICFVAILVPYSINYAIKDRRARLAYEVQELINAQALADNLARTSACYVHELEEDKAKWPENWTDAKERELQSYRSSSKRKVVTPEQARAWRLIGHKPWRT
jgi:hypothetical protein